MSDLPEIYLALGTNLGDRSSNLARARDELKPFVEILQESSVYETPPWGVTDQPTFLNQVLKATSELAPLELLKTVKKIESSMGRVPTIRFGPRLIDIDILLYGDTVLGTPKLVIPHPRMVERAFVLVPLCEISPDLKSPLTGSPYASLLEGMDTTGISKWEQNNA